jgi:hypothetical protein
MFSSVCLRYCGWLLCIDGLIWGRGIKVFITPEATVTFGSTCRSIALNINA